MEEVNWCYLFGITPVCVLFANHSMANGFRLNFENDFGISLKNNMEINLLTETDILYNIDRILIVHPKRIYIDEFQFFNDKTLEMLRERWDNDIYAYGSGWASEYDPKTYSYFAQHPITKIDLRIIV